MNKIVGVKSVDFRIIGKGHGVVNWNGPTAVSDEGMTRDNHTMPKLRGYTNLSGKVKDTGYKYRKEASDIDFKVNSLYISQNCLRHHLFREHAFDLHFSNEKNVDQVLASMTGLIRGYVIPSCQFKRTSPLLIEDLVDQLGNGNFEQFGQAGQRDSSSFYSKTTFGDTEYHGYGSISIEQLGFISLDNKFDRAAMTIEDGQGEVIASSIQDFIQSLDGEAKPVVTFHENYVRQGTIFDIGEAGVLLNDNAISVLVKATLDKIQTLNIRQARSYMYVDEIEVDYNDSDTMMRIKRMPQAVESEPQSSFATYFEAK